MKTLIFDTETTGLVLHPNTKDSKQPRIIEWGGLLVDSRGGVLKELNIIINPNVAIEPIITKITGLTDDDVRNAPSFADVASKIMPMYEDADQVIAHNLPFDFAMIELDRKRAAIDSWPWPERRICTVQEHAEAWGKFPKLLHLYEHYTGQPLDQKHRAIDDVYALAEVCKRTGLL